MSEQTEQTTVTQVTPNTTVLAPNQEAVAAVSQQPTPLVAALIEPANPPADPAKAATELALKVPDDSFLKPSEVEQIKSYAKEKGLTNDQAQELLNQRHDAIQEFVKDRQAENAQVQAQWLEQVKSDPEIGGEAFGQNVEIAKRALDKWASPEIRQYLEETQLGNNPNVVKFFVRIGKAMANDTLVVPGAQSGASGKTAEERMYPNHKQNN